MSWVKLDDGFHRNTKQLSMSDGAFRLYVCALSYCAQEHEPTGYLSDQQALTLRRSLGKGPKAIEELVRLNAWEAVNGGYLVHDYDEYLEKGSRDRVRKHRELKRLGNDDVTLRTPNSRPKGNVTDPLLARDGYPVPEPVPVIYPPSAPPTREDPVEKSPDMARVGEVLAGLGIQRRQRLA